MTFLVTVDGKKTSYPPEDLKSLDLDQQVVVHVAGIIFQTLSALREKRVDLPPPNSIEIFEHQARGASIEHHFPSDSPEKYLYQVNVSAPLAKDAVTITPHQLSGTSYHEAGHVASRKLIHLIHQVETILLPNLQNDLNRFFSHQNFKEYPQNLLSSLMIHRYILHDLAQQLMPLLEHERQYRDIVKHPYEELSLAVNCFNQALQAMDTAVILIDTKDYTKAHELCDGCSMALGSASHALRRYSEYWADRFVVCFADQEAANGFYTHLSENLPASIYVPTHPNKPDRMLHINRCLEAGINGDSLRSRLTISNYL